MNDPLVSVTIPLYNAEKYIKATIDSILEQSFQDFEIVVVDDCSKDRSVEVVKSMSDHRIRLVCNEENLGPKGNWNKCLSGLRGQYIKLVCGDDALEPDCLAQQVAVFQQNPEVSLVSGNRKIINDDKELMIRKPGYSTGLVNKEKFIRDLVLKGTNPIGEPAAVMFRKKDVERLPEGFREPFYTIDVDYWYRLLEFGELYHIDRVLSSFRISKNSGTASIGMQQHRQYMMFVDRLRSDFPKLISQMDCWRAQVKTRLLSFARVAYTKLFV